MAKDQNEVGVGMVIRDYISEFYAGMRKWGSRVASAEAAELVAVQDVNIFVTDVGFKDMMLEGDNLGVINADINRVGRSCWFFLLLKDMVMLLFIR